MKKRLVASLAVAGAIIITTSSVQAGMVGHISAVPIGPAFKHTSIGEADAAREGQPQVRPKEGMESSGYQGREAVETGKLPESNAFDSNGAAVEEIGGTHYRKGIDTGP